MGIGELKFELFPLQLLLLRESLLVSFLCLLTCLYLVGSLIRSKVQMVRDPDACRQPWLCDRTGEKQIVVCWVSFAQDGIPKVVLERQAGVGESPMHGGITRGAEHSSR